ncbi:MAG: ribonuclease HII [Candidatus Buchananbacteria bacterium RIFCSPHIGHO2_01_FULL_39_14]|uniref:Ribonuclease HII n=2 Tax=Candidatus Buchananiibacteriota TaxID=1817903 RepID=A0A1G1YU42_9BACT|nr:MAG: ribonuclease HII [Candidatus Buchananbacteria bacterium RIFCSPHIGHO2_01_FULL_39_14]OGY48464.1 MAG: ribonuclease HII [Candidatus Buchananbacteria bacterium RIFCSPHIGHO2_02_FULL_39_17]OGY55296.1 MAG: ribonuclease HII [Candidatus Buchananbacteria bacterium RIFCSPLOWO2_01_FULL_40_23b]
MIFPHFLKEKKLRRQGYKLIAGLDEAGKGAWAGPIVAAAVILDPKIKIKGIKDSKLLRAPERQKLFEEIISQAVGWAIGAVSQQKIDESGIVAANIMAMQQALKKLLPAPDYLLVDAIKINYQNLPALSIIDGDYKIRSIAAASIVAKVTRDRLMDELDEKYPQYGFKQHKGYGTNHHFQMIAKYGAADIHRQTFEPVKHFLND